MQVNSFKNKYERAHLHKVVGKEPATLIKYEFF